MNMSQIFVDNRRGRPRAREPPDDRGNRFPAKLFGVTGDLHAALAHGNLALF